MQKRNYASILIKEEAEEAEYERTKALRPTIQKTS